MVGNSTARRVVLALIGWLVLAIGGSARTDQATRSYLPLVLSAPRVDPIVFASRFGDDGTPIDPGYSFPYGITRLYAIVTVYNGEGFFWKVEWDFPGGTTGLDCRSDPSHKDNQCPILEPAIRFTPLIYYQSGQPLGPGTYRFRFYLNDVLYQAGTAEIR